MRTAAIGTTLVTLALLYSDTSEAQVRTRCWAFGLLPGPMGGESVLIAGADKTFRPSTLLPDPKRTPDSCSPRSEDSREFGDKRFGTIVVSMSKCQSDEPDFTGRLFLPGSKFAVALNFSKDQRLATANLIFQATDPFTLADGRPAQRLHFACAIVR